MHHHRLAVWIRDLGDDSVRSVALIGGLSERPHRVSRHVHPANEPQAKLLDNVVYVFAFNSTRLAGLPHAGADGLVEVL